MPDLQCGAQKGSLLTFVMPLGHCSVQVFRDGQLLKAFARVFAGRHEYYHAMPCTWVEYGRPMGNSQNRTGTFEHVSAGKG